MVRLGLANLSKHNRIRAVSTFAPPKECKQFIDLFTERTHARAPIGQMANDITSLYDLVLTKENNKYVFELNTTCRYMHEVGALEASIPAMAVLLYPRAKIFLERVQIPSKKISEQHEF